MTLQDQYEHMRNALSAQYEVPKGVCYKVHQVVHTWPTEQLRSEIYHVEYSLGFVRLGDLTRELVS